MTDPLHILSLSCPDQPGIVSRVTGLLFATGGNIREAAQFEDQDVALVGGAVAVAFALVVSRLLWRIAGLRLAIGLI